MVRKIFVFLLISLVLIQFIRPARNIGAAASAADITHYVHVPDTVMRILQTSCYDCHSNHTVYPWYTNINPVGFWMWGHIEEGKESINFSDLTRLDKRRLAHRLGDIAEEVEKKDMPLPSYTLIHGYATLSDGQIQLVKDWVAAAQQEVTLQK